MADVAKPRAPTRAQWTALCWIRKRNAESEPSSVGGITGRTKLALERHQLAYWRDREGWILTPAGLAAVAIGDRKYGLSQPAHSAELIVFVLNEAAKERKKNQ